jgi:hypothetical protein
MVIAGGYAFFQWIDFFDFVAQPVQGTLDDNFKRHLYFPFFEIDPDLSGHSRQREAI